MLNRIWGGIFLIALLTGTINSVTQGASVINAMAASLFDSAKLGVEISIGLIGALALWLGLFQIAEAAGIVAFLARQTTPVLHRLMPSVPKDHPAFGSISMNVAMSMLGIDNGALPSGLKAMRELEALNTTPSVATKAQQMFLVYMTTSVTLFPVSILSYRLQAGAANPADIFLPLIITGYAGLLVGLGYMSAVLKINWLNLKSALALLLLMVVLSGLALLAATWPAQELNEKAGLFGNVLILAVLAWFIAVGLYKRLAIFDLFTRGASQGFTLAVELIPYLVGMLVAIGLLRSSGAFSMLQSSLEWLCRLSGVDDLWTQVLPHGLMKLFSGSGARSLMLEAFNFHGVDSLVGHLSAVVQGAFDTTFYVLVACAAAAKLHNLGHAVTGALLANGTSFVVAVLCTQFFFQ